MNNSKTASKNYIIKPSVVDGYITFWSIMHGLLFMAVLIYGYYKTNKFPYLFATVALLIFKVYVYQLIDLIFSKKIILLPDRQFYIRIFGFNWKINKEQCYLMIDEMFIPSTVSTKDAVLMLYRNNTSFWSKLFKNKIKLHSIDNVNFEQIRSEAKTISALFEIPFRDIYKYR